MRKIIVVIIILIAAGAIVGLYLYNKPAQITARGKAQVSIDAEKLVSAYVENEDAANASYLGKVIEVRGTISEVSNEADHVKVLLSSGEGLDVVSCTIPKTGNMKHSPESLSTGQVVLVKGECTGFLSGLMNDVVMDKCIIVEIL